MRDGLMMLKKPGYAAVLVLIVGTIAFVVLGIILAIPVANAHAEIVILTYGVVLELFGIARGYWGLRAKAIEYSSHWVEGVRLETMALGTTLALLADVSTDLNDMRAKLNRWRLNDLTKDRERRSELARLERELEGLRKELGENRAREDTRTKDLEERIEKLSGQVEEGADAFHAFAFPNLPHELMWLVFVLLGLVFTNYSEYLADFASFLRI